MSYRLSVVTPPTVYPVSVADVKLHARVSGTAEDSLISHWIAAGTELAEAYLGTAYGLQTLEMALHDWPDGDLIPLPRTPVASVDSITYRPEGGEDTTLDPSAYRLSVSGWSPYIVLDAAQDWPAVVLDNFDAIKIRFEAGTAAATAPACVQDAIYLYCTWRYENRTAESSTVPPAFYHLMRHMRRLRV